jgi:hypothetical protein
VNGKKTRTRWGNSKPEPFKAGEQLYIYVYVYKCNNDISKIISKIWKDLTARQRIYSGSATRTPSLPYSTPRVTYSRVFFTMSTSSLWRRNLTHQYTHHLHTKASSQRNHTFFTTTSHQSTTHLSSQLLHTNLLHTYLHNYFTPIYYTPIFYTPIIFTTIY